MDSFFRKLNISPKLITDQNYSSIEQIKSYLCHLQITNWINDDLHKWTWWLNLFLSIIPVLVLWKIIDRNRFLQIIVYGLLVAMISTFLDVLGSAYMLWDYPDKLLPIVPRLFPVDFIGLPFVYMLIYQRYSSWKEFIIASSILSALLAFVGEPIFVWLNLYDPISWHYYYSFPMYFIIAVVVRWFTGILVAQDAAYN